MPGGSTQHDILDAIRGQGSTPSSPTVSNLTLTTQDTEYSLALPANCKAFSLQCRTSAAVRLAFETGKVAGPTEPYATVKADGAYTSPEWMNASSLTIYLAGGSGGLIVEIISWS